MGLETFTDIASLNILWPLDTDVQSQGDDHIRGVKVVIKSIQSNFAQLGGTAPKWQKTTIAETALTDADASQDIALITLTQFEKVIALCIKHSTTFSGGTLTGMKVSVGTASSPTFYSPAFDIFQPAGDLAFFDMTGFGSITMAGGGHSIIAQFTSVGDNVVNAAAGSVDIWINTVKME